MILLASVCVHAQTDDKTTLKQLNENLVSSYKNGKLDDALKFANQAVELSVKTFGLENAETATAYSNLGVIQQQKQKYKDSISSFQKAIDIYLKLPNLKDNGLIESYENIALSQFWEKKYEDSTTNYLKTIELAEAKFGKESKASFSATMNLANVYSKNKKFEKADEYYLKSISLALKYFGQSSTEFLQIDFVRRGVCHEDKQLDETYLKAKKEILAKQPVSDLVGVISVGVVNGKATLLAKPSYPAEAKEKKLSGAITVHVLIDEQGNVTFAKANCGQGILGDAAEDAALRSKFSPSILNGKAVKTSGIVVYNFVVTTEIHE